MTWAAVKPKWGAWRVEWRQGDIFMSLMISQYGRCSSISWQGNCRPAIPDFVEPFSEARRKVKPVAGRYGHSASALRGELAQAVADILNARSEHQRGART